MTEPAPLPSAVPLDGRGVVAISGADRVNFLQGLVSNDVARVAPDRAVWAAMLTPQGKFLHEFVIYADGERLLLDVEAERRDDFLRRLRLYKLRSRIVLEDLTDSWRVVALAGSGAAAAAGLPDVPGAAGRFGTGIASVDPRHAALGVRLLLPRADQVLAVFPAGMPADWDRTRIPLGVPDGSRDMVPERAILLENGFDELNGVSWDKGCYMGQELTARTKYRALIRKRLVPVSVDGALPAPGTPVLRDGIEVGELRSGLEGMALALLRIDSDGDGGSLRAGDSILTVHKPAWARF